MKSILVIQGGGRPKGNTAQLVDHFIKGAEDAGHPFDECREGQKPRPLGRFKFDAPLLAAGFLTLRKLLTLYLL